MTQGSSYESSRKGGRRRSVGGARGALMLLAAFLCLSACQGKTPPAGLEVIITTSGLQAGVDFDAIEGVVEQQTPTGTWNQLFKRSAYVPSEVTLPTTLAVDPGTSPDQDALITVSALKNGVPIVQRAVQLQIPTDRVAELLMTLAADCLGKVSLCPAEESCQPQTGMCGTNLISEVTLPDAGTPLPVSGSTPFPDGGSTDASDATEDSTTEGGSDATTGVGNDATAQADVSDSSDVGNDATSQDDGASAGSDAQSEDSSNEPDPCHGSCGPHQTCAVIGDVATCTCTVDPTCTAPGDVCTSSTSLVECVTDDQGCTYSFSTSTCSACPHGCLVTMVASTDPPLVVSAEYGIVLTRDALYWLSAGAGITLGFGGIFSVPLHGGPPIWIAHGYAPAYFAINATSAFYGDVMPDSGYTVQELLEVALDGGAPLPLVVGSASPGSMVADPENVYWSYTDDVDGAVGILRTPTAGGGTTTPFQASALTLVGIQGSRLYWTTSNVDAASIIQSAPLDGGAVTVVPQSENVTGAAALDGTYVYWATSTFSDGSPNVLLSSSIFRALLIGGTPTLVASSAWGVGSIAADANAIYWTAFNEMAGQEGGAILYVPLSGALPGVPATLVGGLLCPQSIAVDADAVYFYDDCRGGAGLGAIMKYTK
jgi:hypothetical protein